MLSLNGVHNKSLTELVQQLKVFEIYKAPLYSNQLKTHIE